MQIRPDQVPPCNSNVRAVQYAITFDDFSDLPSGSKQKAFNGIERETVNEIDYF